MRIAYKLALALIFGFTVVLAVQTVLNVRREQALFAAEARAEQVRLGETLGAFVAEVWKVEGEARAMELITQAHQTNDAVSFRWVWLDGATPGVAPRVPLELLTEARADTAQIIVQADDIYGYAPVPTGSERPGAIEISRSRSEEHAYVRESIARNAATALVLVLVSAVMMLVLGAWLVGRPVDRLVARLRRIGAGDLTGHLELERRDELALLTHEVNALARHLRHADRLTTVGTVAAGVAHELGTPLQIVDAGARLIESETSLDGAREQARDIATQATRMKAIIRNLLDFARRREPNHERFNVRDVVQQALNMLKSLAGARGVTLELLDGPPVDGLVDLTQLQQALTNLVMNAVYASSRGGRVEVSVSEGDATPPPEVGGPPGHYIRMTIRDFGEGMTEQVKENVFRPFFTTRAVGEGTGLGVPIALAIVREHGGWIDVESATGKGTCFTLYLAGGNQVSS